MIEKDRKTFFKIMLAMGGASKRGSKTDNAGNISRAELGEKRGTGLY